MGIYSDISTVMIERDMKNKKTLLALRKKAGLKYGETARMPNLNKVADLLKEVGIECNVTTWSCMKYGSAAGCRYITNGGTRDYEGYRLKVAGLPTINSTDTYYSWNNQRYAQQLVELVENNI
jgi:hypothetical protein